MYIGYIRLSQNEPNIDNQLTAIKKFNCAQIFIDKTAKVTDERIEFLKALSILKEGDCLVIWKLNKIGRTLKQLLTVIDSFRQKNINLISIQDRIDTTVSEGQYFFNFFNLLKTFEQDITKERTLIGLATARVRGRKGGRPAKFNFQQIQLAKQLYADKKLTIAEICKTVGMTKPTLYKYLNKKIVINAHDVSFINTTKLSDKKNHEINIYPTISFLSKSEGCIKIKQKIFEEKQ